jgi:hypothetical protein
MERRDFLRASIIELNYRLPKFKLPAKVWLALPPDLPNQEVKIKSITPPPLKEFKEGSNTIAYFELDKAEDIRINMKVIRHEVNGPQRGEVSQKEIESEPFIEVNEEVRNRALEIVGDIKDKEKQARILFIWVRDNMKYKHPPKVWGNLSALQSKRGDCGSSSFLFASFCRALKIPARVVFGRVVREGGQSTPHAWAECYIEGWLPVDCTMAKDVKKLFFSASDYFGIPHDPDYYFGNLDDKRLVYSLGTGINSQVAYPQKRAEKGYKVKTHDGAFFWCKELYRDKIPFLQPVYYAAGVDKITQGKLRVKVPLIKRIIDPIMAKFCALLILPFVFLRLVSASGRYMLIGAVMAMLLGNTLTWRGKTRIFWLSILLGAVAVLVYTFIA